MDWTTIYNTPAVYTRQESVTSASMKNLLESTIIPNTNDTVTWSTNYSTSSNVADVLSDMQSNIAKRLVEILRNEYNSSAAQYFSKLAGIPSYTRPTTTTIRIPYTSGVVSWGFITPITLIGIFLVAVAVCLCYHNWLDKRRLRSYSHTVQISDFSSANAKLDSDTRGSIRSNCSGRSMGSNTRNKRQMLPLPRKDSLGISRVEEGWKITGQPKIQLSPIHENDSTFSKTNITEIKPKFERFSSYHITWISETTKDVKLGKELGTPPIHLTDNPLSDQLRSDQLYEDSKVTQLEQKSPYYPHNNTPTDEYEGEYSGNLNGGDSAASTHINDNLSLPSTIYPIVGRAPPSLTDGADISSIHTYLDHHRPPSSRRDDLTVESEDASATTSFTESASGTLSLPSSIYRFHASRLNNTPNYPYPLASTHNGSQVKLNFTVTSSVDLSNNSQYSDNTSMFPNVGSSITSFGPSVPRSNATSSCPSDIFSPDYIYGNIGRSSGTEQSTRQSSFSTNSGEGHPLPTADNNQISVAREAEIFRNWSLSAVINSGSLNNLPGMAPNSLPSSELYSIILKDDSAQSKSEGHITSHSYDINGNLSPIDNRKVKFSVPALNKKQYWV